MGPGGSSAELKGGMMLARDINKLKTHSFRGLDTGGQRAQALGRRKCQGKRQGCGGNRHG